MNRNLRRFLTAGVSLGALAAVPGHAATVTTETADPGVQNGFDQTYSDDTVDITLVLSDIGDDFFYGVTDTADGAATAIVSSTTDPNGGLIWQTGTATAGDATLVLSNVGTATVGAIATASGAGAQTAVASVGTGVGTTAAIYQGAFATATTGAADAAFANSGVVNVLASANAISTAATAEATAHIETGLWQQAQGGVSGSASILNDGDISISAVANATASEGTASANTDILHGIYQTASASLGDASVSLTNNGGDSDLRYCEYFRLRRLCQCKSELWHLPIC